MRDLLWLRRCWTTLKTIAPCGCAGPDGHSLAALKDADDAFNKPERFTTKKEDHIYLLFLKGELAERQKHYEPASSSSASLGTGPRQRMTLNYLAICWPTKACGCLRRSS